MPKDDKATNSWRKHRPVMVKEVIDCLQPKAGESYLDLTAGYGGHAARVLDITKAPESGVLVDRDPAAVDYLNQHGFNRRCRIIQSDFASASQTLAENAECFDMILADLGVSSPHLDNAERGFSVSDDGPLDMRMDFSQELTAEMLVNQWEEDALADVLRRYGEEPKARTIAKRIIAGRPIRTTGDLAAIVARAWPGRSRVHPATRTFQALRIAVNDELNQLERSLPLWLKLLAPGGRLAVISFHSLEDRLVKKFLSENSGGLYDSSLTILTKKPLTAQPDEIVSNPRARSAKLRAAAKIKTKKKGLSVEAQCQ